jgi:hypothetical protein
LVAALLAVSLGTWLGGTGLIVPTNYTIDPEEKPEEMKDLQEYA